jgi:hypothetical protein
VECDIECLEITGNRTFYDKAFRICCSAKPSFKKRDINASYCVLDIQFGWEATLLGLSNEFMMAS